MTIQSLKIKKEPTTSNRYWGIVNDSSNEIIKFTIDVINQHIICSINYLSFSHNKDNFHQISYQHRKHTNWKTRYNHQLKCIEITRQFNKTSHQDLSEIIKPFLNDIELIREDVQK